MFVLGSRRLGYSNLFCSVLYIGGDPGVGSGWPPEAIQRLILKEKEKLKRLEREMEKKEKFLLSKIMD